MIIDVGYWTRIFKNILILVISLLLIFFALKLAIFYMPFLIGFIISLLIEPLLKIGVKKTKQELKKVAIVVLIIIIGIILGLLTWGIVSLITESSNLLQGFNNNVEIMYEKAKDYISNIKDGKTKIPAEIITIAENSTDNDINYKVQIITNSNKAKLNITTNVIKANTPAATYPIVSFSNIFIQKDKLNTATPAAHAAAIHTFWSLYPNNANKSKTAAAII